MESTEASGSREQRYRALFDAAYPDLLRFARRRVHPTHAEDLVADVMLVAWRRLDDVPVDLPAARAWLFGVAHKSLQNTRRREGRQTAVAVQLAELPAPDDVDPSPDAVAARLDVAAAWPHLTAVHQEALALSVLDGLTAPEAAQVLGITPVAFRLRLSRARRALRQLIDSPASSDHATRTFASERNAR